MGLFNFNHKKHQEEAAEKPAVQHDPDEIINLDEAVESVTNDELLSKWNSFSIKQSDENMSAFLEELIENSHLITIALSDKPVKAKRSGEIILDDDSQLQFPLLTTPDHQSFQPMFTDWMAVTEMFDAWEKNGQGQDVSRAHGLVVRFTDMHEMVAQNKEVHGAVINPFSDNITLDEGTLDDLYSQAQARHGADEDGNVPVEVAEPAEVPDKLWQPLAEALKANPSVSRAWMMLLRFNENVNYFLIVDTDEEDDEKRDAFFGQLTAIAQEALVDDQFGFNAGVLSDDVSPVIDNVEPRYVRA